MMHVQLFIFMIYVTKKKKRDFGPNFYCMLIVKIDVVIVFVFMPKKKLHSKYSAATKRPGDTCPAGEWQCDSGECINSEFLCDKQTDCTDNSDEGSICRRKGKVLLQKKKKKITKLKKIHESVRGRRKP